VLPIAHRTKDRFCISRARTAVYGAPSEVESATDKLRDKTMDMKKVFAFVVGSILWVSSGGPSPASERTYGTQKEIAQIKLEYAAIYNQLNKNPQYDIVCPKSGTARLCMPRYLDAARRKALKKVGSCPVLWDSATPGMALPCPTASDFFQDREFVAAARALEPGFHENAQQIVQQSPRLQALRLKLEAMESRR
jgi:hypothetical protein